MEQAFLLTEGISCTVYLNLDVALTSHALNTHTQAGSRCKSHLGYVRSGANHQHDVVLLCSRTVREVNYQTAREANLCRRSEVHG